MLLYVNIITYLHVIQSEASISCFPKTIPYNVKSEPQTSKAQNRKYSEVFLRNVLSPYNIIQTRSTLAQIIPLIPTAEIALQQVITCPMLFKASIIFLLSCPYKKKTKAPICDKIVSIWMYVQHCFISSLALQRS